MTFPGFSAKAVDAVNKVETVRGVQRHRGFTGIVYIPGHKRPFRTGTFHQKRKTAQAAAEKFGRWIVKDPANLAQAIEWRDQK